MSQKTDAARMNKHHIEMLHFESWKSICVGTRRPNVKVMRHKNIAGVDFFALVSAWFLLVIRDFAILCVVFNNTT